jgi:16S rRNA (guanine(966)-N(2))-methyltransferase RsmD
VLRVIAGTAKGVRLYAPGNMNVRPILDRIKESLFSLLSDRVEGARVLDLFAGTGSIGIEALSRGAEHVDFIELDRKTAESIKANLERASMSTRARVINGRLPSALRRVRPEYGLIFADPPFKIDARIMEELFRVMCGKGLLCPGGLLIYRHSPRAVHEPPPPLCMCERRDYGDSIISVYSVCDEADGFHADGGSR